MSRKQAAIVAAVRATLDGRPDDGATAGNAKRATREAASVRADAAEEGQMRRYRVTVDGHAYEVTVEEMPEAAAERPAFPAPAPAPAKTKRQAGPRIQAPMPGKILDVRVKPGDTVATGMVLLVLEAMKMENDIVASRSGTVNAVHVRAGDTVNTGDPLVAIE